MVSPPNNQNEQYRYELKIPKERVAVLIGTKGETKRLIEQETSTKLDIDSKEGDVFISGEDSLGLFVTREIISAIGRGFNPNIALKLRQIDYIFELINLNEIARSKNDLIRIKGRIIGEDGKSRKTIEELTGCEICVYGKTVGIIGSVEEAPIARKAIEMLLEGSMHASVFRFLEKKRKEIKENHFREKII